MLKVIPFLFLLFATFLALAQQSTDSLELLLNEKAKSYAALNSKLEISVSDVALDEFLRAIAVANKLNFDIADDLDYNVVNNFTGVPVKDMLAYLCKQYQLTLEFTGNIISIRKAPVQKKSYIPETYAIAYDSTRQSLTINFKNDSLYLIAEQITRITNANVILAPGIGDKLISAYIQNMPVESALDKLAFSNDLKLNKTDDGFYLLEPNEELSRTNEEPAVARSTRTRTGNSRSTGTQNNKEEDGFIQLKKTNQGTLNVLAEHYPMAELIKKASEELKKNYFIVSKLEELVNINIENATYDELLSHIFDGTKYMFKKTKQYYVIGDRASQEIKESRVITLQNRTVDKLIEGLPADVLKDIDAKEFPEMNSILVNGHQTILDDFELFVQEIDQTVPVILIEVMIVYVNKNRGISTGLDAGLGETPTTTSGTLNPGFDFTLGATNLNNLINSFDGFGWLNLSDMNPNFYLHLKMLEEAGFLDIKSTPKLSTLNGHEAKMSIGNTEYYQEEQTQIIGTQNPQTNTTTTYKSVQADLSVTILPIVSGKENITMQISVSQSDFTEKISKYAPPNTVNRSFESNIRVKNGELILLGGLEEAEKSESSSGWPILSRIPVVKWIFSSRSKKVSNSKLTVFIKPTIIP
jgi:type IV pilus assembly protein PilQ